jgi:hypothetical protein
LDRYDNHSEHRDKVALGDAFVDADAH